MTSNTYIPVGAQQTMQINNNNKVISDRKYLLITFILFLLQRFRGNYDRYHTVAQRVSPYIRARYLRIHPKTWRSYIAMRVEVYGCRYKGELVPYPCLSLSLSSVIFRRLTGPLAATRVTAYTLINFMCIWAPF